MIMQAKNWGIALGLVVVLGVSAALADAYSVPKQQFDPKKVYWGSAGSFEHAGEMDYQRVIKATPEYSQIKRKRIQRGTGKYWILLSQASDRVVRTISRVGQKTECDLIAARGYLAGLEPPIPAEDVTQLMLDTVQGKVKAKVKQQKNKR